MSDDVVRICRDAYAETSSLYAARAPQFGDAARGFRILYGPPVPEPPILFLGYQPGGHEPEPDQHEGWPAVCDYAVADWPLARRLRDVFGAERVARCTGLNAVFFRAPTVAAWRRIDPGLRRELEAFSLAWVEHISRALRPRRIVVIGLGTLAGLCASTIVLQGEKGVLVRRGELWGAPAYGVVHLSGARVSRVDLDALRGFFARKVDG